MVAMALPTGIITCLPDADIDDLVAVIEVLVQENLPTFAVHAKHLAELRGIFGSRAAVGAWRVNDMPTLEAALDAGAEFVLADVADRDMVIVSERRQTPFYAQAMTPLEIRAILELGATGAIMWPTDVVGHIMATRLEEVGLADRVIPMGGVAAFSAGEWLKRGAPAACVDAPLLGDAVEGGDLGKLRDRCGSFRKAIQQAVAARAGETEGSSN